MFKFNFQINESGESSQLDCAPKTEVGNSKVLWIKPQMIRATNEHIQDAFEHICLNKNLNYFTLARNELRFVNTDGLEKNFEASTTSFSHSVSDSDLVPSVYEGGLKIWECTWDLLNYMNEKKLDFKNKRVLELGCGAGLPGIAAAITGAFVTFQDYNVEVLNWSTIPNVILNYDVIFHTQNPVEIDDVNLSSINSQFNFYSGDWDGLSSLLLSGGRKFDFILSSETIYNLENQPKLLNIFMECLEDDGTVILAVKSHYFGVGGGTYDFIKLVEERIAFDTAVTVCNSEGVKREILILRKRS